MNFVPLRIHMVILETHGDYKYHTDLVDEQHIISELEMLWKQST